MKLCFAVVLFFTYGCKVRVSSLISGNNLRVAYKTLITRRNVLVKSYREKRNTYFMPNRKFRSPLVFEAVKELGILCYRLTTHSFYVVSLLNSRNFGQILIKLCVHYYFCICTLYMRSLTTCDTAWAVTLRLPDIGQWQTLQSWRKDLLCT
jgi:hypothetical protein